MNVNESTKGRTVGYTGAAMAPEKKLFSRWCKNTEDRSCHEVEWSENMYVAAAR